MIPLIKNMLIPIVNFILLVLRSIFANHRPKAIDERKYVNNVINVSRNDIEYILASSNVIRITVDKRICYFREFERHLPINEYVAGFIDEYFDLVAPPNYNTADKQRILNDLIDKENFKMFINMGATYPVTTSFHRFYTNGENPEILGLSTPNDEEYTKRLKTFCRFSSNKLNAYNRENMYLFNNSRHYFSAVRNLAFKKMLDLFDISEYAPDLHCCFLVIDKKYKMFGSVMENADGINITEKSFEERKSRVTPKIQNHLTNLNLIDYLCEIIDHTPRNYNVVTDANGFYIGLQCFDNDDQGSFGYKKSLVFKSYPNVSSFVRADKTVARPYLDKDIAKTVINMKKSVIIEALSGCLRREQIHRIWQRLCFLKTAITQTQNKKTHFLLAKNEWNQDTINEELSGKYGNTYLTNLIELGTGPKVEILNDKNL